MALNYFQLKNGIRVIHKPVLNEVAHCGFIVNTGSRDEEIDESGITHFIEHAVFKGTKKRKTYHILNRIDNVGGEINAYTTKENTNIYASFTKNYFERALELLCDILFNSIYPEHELQKEKEVIIDEIHSYQDNPYEQIYDDFEEKIFKDHPLGMNILGTEDSVKKITREKILQFIQAHYFTDQIVLSIVGDIPLRKIKRLCEKYLHPVEEKTSPCLRKTFTNYQVTQEKVVKDIYQTHYITGNIAYGADHEYKNGLILLNNILGGPAMNSRLNMSIREKYGFTYNIESSYTIYSDIGLIYIYLGTDEKHLDKSIRLIQRELKIFREKKISSSQLQKAKQQLIGQITLSEENNCNVMLGMGKSLLLYDRVDNLRETFNKINVITESQLMEIANEVFDEKELSSLLFISK